MEGKGKESQNEKDRLYAESVAAIDLYESILHPHTHAEKAERAKWNPTSFIAKKDLSRANWQLGKGNEFHSGSTSRNDYCNHVVTDGNEVAAKR